MNRAMKTAGSILALGTLLVAFNLGGSAGCGSSSGGGGGGGADDAAVTATDADADAAFGAASQAIGSALTAATGSGGLTLQGSGKLAQAVGVLKNTITVDDTITSCSEGNVPSPSDNSETVNGSDIFSPNGDGSCTVSWDESSNSFDVLLACDNLTDGTVTLDGALGFEAAASDSNFSLDVGSQDLSFSFDGNNCSLIVNLSVDVVSSGNGATVTATGCLGVCGEFFGISGSESF